MKIFSSPPFLFYKKYIMKEYFKISWITYWKIEFYYDKGWMNRWSWNTEDRWYRISVSKVEKWDWRDMHTPMDDCNFRFLVEQTKRYSKKRFEELAIKIQTAITMEYELEWFETIDKQNFFNFIMNKIQW